MAQPSTLDPSLALVDLELLAHDDHVAAYRALDPATGRAVQLLLSDESAPPLARERLHREARHLALLGGHRHVQTLYSVTDLPDGRTALALAWCPGSVVDEVAAAGAAPPSVPGVVALGATLAAALETAHRAGVVHTAVRPEVVLRDEFGAPVLAGFGAATGPDDRDFVLREAGPFTAPELLFGERPTPATDVYGLAATLHALLTGRPPHRVGDDADAAAASLAILTGTVHPIAAPGVPIELSDLVLWGLAGEPGGRPPGAAWFGEELARIEQRHGWPRTRAVAGEPRRRGD